jgi:hypothetical protein
MKKSALLFLLVAVLAGSSCKKESVTGEHNIDVDMQFGFDNDQVAIYIDEEEKYNSVITSNNAIGFASTVPGVLKAGTHVIKAVMNNDITITRVFFLHEDLYIGVSHLGGNKMEIMVQDEPFIYE